MQRLAHQGAALSVTIIPDCLCSTPPPQALPPPLTYSPPRPPSTSRSPPLGTTRTVVYEPAQTRKTQTNK